MRVRVGRALTPCERMVTPTARTAAAVSPAYLLYAFTVALRGNGRRGKGPSQPKTQPKTDLS